MAITIQLADKQLLTLANQIDNSFIVQQQLILSTHNNTLSYHLQTVTPYSKTYPTDDLPQLICYITDSDKAALVAVLEQQPIALLCISKHWNNYALINDLRVAPPYRQQGIAKQLINRAIDWAKQQNLKGLTLETQQNNVPACLLYQQCGFSLRGFDQYLYKGLAIHQDEIALFWYLAFD